MQWGRKAKPAAICGSRSSDSFQIVLNAVCWGCWGSSDVKQHGLHAVPPVLELRCAAGSSGVWGGVWVPLLSGCPLQPTLPAALLLGGGERTSKGIGCVGRVHGKTLCILKFGSLNSELFAKGELQALLSLRSKCCCSPAAVFEDKPQFGREPLLPLWLFVSQTGLVSYQSYKPLRLMTDPAARAVLCPAKLLVGWVWRWEDRAMGKVS